MLYTSYPSHTTWEGVGEIDRGKMARMLGGSRRERVEWLMKGGGGEGDEDVDNEEVREELV